MNQLASYTATRSPGNLIQANDNVDVLLDTLIRFASDEAKRSADKEVSVRVDDQLSTITKRALETARTFQAEIEQNRKSATEELAAIRKARNRASEFQSRLLEGAGGEPSVQSKIDGFLSEASQRAAEIKGFHATLIVGTPKEESTQSQVKAAATKISETQSKVDSILQSLSDQSSDLADFHRQIFGDGKDELGLKGELDQRRQQLSEFEDLQRSKLKTLTEQVEELLPGAASAGLASSFQKMRGSFDTPILVFTYVFYGAIACMLLVALGFSFTSFTLNPLSWQLAQSSEWTDTLRRLLDRLPVLIPLVWLAVFSANRRRQYERLQQEYAHKQALASSYESYKRQIEELGVDSEALLKELIDSAIRTVAFNASSTLDSQQTQKPSIYKSLESLSPADLEKLVEHIKSLRKG